MAMDKQRKTFLSYSRVNKDFAIRLAQELKAEGFDIWLDQLDIPPGAWWDDEVERALEECEIFMVIVTPSSSASKNVKDEIGYALDANKRILPILLENATLPLRLRRLQYVDFTGKGFDEGVNAAKDLLRRLIAQSTLPRIELSEEERHQLAQADAERKAKEEAERQTTQKAEQERLGQQQEEERLARAKADAERLAAQKAEEERVAKQQAEEERLAKAKADAERLAKAEADRKAKAESKRKAKEAAERLATQKAEEERLAKQKQDAEQALAAKAEAERIAVQKAEEERKAKQQAERLAAQKVEAERLAKQKADDQLAAKARADREANAEDERAAKEKSERVSRQRAEQASAEKAKIIAPPVPAKAGPPSAAVVAASRRPVSRGLIFGIAAFVLVFGGIGFGVLSSLRNQSPSSSPDPVANTPANTPTDAQDKAPAPTKTAAPSPTATSIPSDTPEPALGIGSTMTSEKDGMTLLYVPAGDFWMGSNAHGNEEKPEHQVYLDAFWIDQTEITNAMYEKCVNAGDCDPPAITNVYRSKDAYYGNSAYDDYPVVFIQLADARDYCTWAGRRLPTEAEWEKAARGDDGRMYPWGNEPPSSELLNYDDQVGYTTKVGSYPKGASPYGALDMAGNVWEWVSDWWDPRYYYESPDSNPTGPDSGSQSTQRGGGWEAWGQDDYLVRASFRIWADLNAYNQGYGFRCARDE